MTNIRAVTCSGTLVAQHLETAFAWERRQFGLAGPARMLPFEVPEHTTLEAIASRVVQQWFLAAAQKSCVELPEHKSSTVVVTS